jgi:hypothetical protein
MPRTLRQAAQSNAVYSVNNIADCNMVQITFMRCLSAACD